jgi:hypothetical protein
MYEYFEFDYENAMFDWDDPESVKLNNLFLATSLINHQFDT